MDYNGETIVDTIQLDSDMIKEYNISVPVGDVNDVNNDSVVDVLDVTSCVNHILNEQDWGERADVNGDGEVDVEDIQSIVNKIFIEWR